MHRCRIAYLNPRALFWEKKNQNERKASCIQYNLNSNNNNINFLQKCINWSPFLCSMMCESTHELRFNKRRAKSAYTFLQDLLRSMHFPFTIRHRACDSTLHLILSLPCCSTARTERRKTKAKVIKIALEENLSSGSCVPFWSNR